MTIPLVDRNPTPQELEKLRLVLSAYQDGSGMLMLKEGRTLPGWRDFERSVASVFSGKAQENKAIFDVLLSDPARPDLSYGISCKMRATLNKVRKEGRVTVELSNSAGKFWQYLGTKGIGQMSYRQQPNDTGIAIVELVEQWHTAVSIENGGLVDLSRSSYLILSYDAHGSYQLHQFVLNLPDPHTLHWQFPEVVRNGNKEPANHLRGSDTTGTIFEWYGESGGQLKYYPLASSARWTSHVFTLEPLHLGSEGRGLLYKAQTYFPNQWSVTET